MINLLGKMKEADIVDCLHFFFFLLLKLYLGYDDLEHVIWKVSSALCLDFSGFAFKQCHISIASIQEKRAHPDLQFLTSN